MPRPHRPQVAGGVYHLTSRGNRRQTIFRDDTDRKRFLALLARVLDDRGWELFAYCLLGNHYHLLVRTPEPDLAAGMQFLNGDYARGFNDRHDLSGHLFQGRYDSRHVIHDEHLAAAARYIALNPVAADLCADPADWRWSSHMAVLTRDPLSRVAVDAVLDHFAAMRGGDGLSAYLEFVAAVLPADASPLPTLAELRERRSEGEALLAALDCGYTTVELAAVKGCDRTTISRSLRRAMQQKGSDPRCAPASAAR